MTQIICSIIGGIVSVLCVVIPLICSQNKERRNQQKLNDESTLLNLQCNIMNIYNMCKRRKRISRYDATLVDELFKKYFDMGGDGFIHKIQDEMKKSKITN